MNRFVALLCVAAVTGGLVLGLSGCGSTSSGSADATTQAGTATGTAAANAAFCSSLVDVQSALTDVKNLNSSNISVSKLTTTVSSLTTALSQLAAGAKDAVGVDASALQSSFAQLKDDLLAIPGSGQGLSAGLASAQKALVPVQNQLNELKPECSSAGTTTG